MLVGVLFFCLETKEKIPKVKLKAALPGLLRYCHSQTGLELASLKQIAPYLRLTAPTLDAPTVRPGDHAAYGGMELIFFSDGS